MNTNQILIENINACIKQSGIAENEILRLCGIHGNFLANLRSGRLKHPRLIHVYQIARYFNVSIDSLVGYTADSFFNEYTSEYEFNDIENYKLVFNAYRQLDTCGKNAVNNILNRELMRVIDVKK